MAARLGLGAFAAGQYRFHLHIRCPTSSDANHLIKLVRLIIGKGRVHQPGLVVRPIPVSECPSRVLYIVTLIATIWADYEPHRALEGRPAEEIATEPAPTRHPREDHEQEIKEKSKFERH